MTRSKRGEDAPFYKTASAAFDRVLSDDAPYPSLLRKCAFNHSFEPEVTRIHPDPELLRPTIDQEELRVLAATMKLHGQLQPILVRQHPELRNDWMIVLGERRWRAAVLNGWKTMLVLRHDGDPAVAALVESLHRSHVAPAETARRIESLISRHGWSRRDAAQKLGISVSRLGRMLRIPTLPPDSSSGSRRS